jgi:hypothetical protein
VFQLVAKEYALVKNQEVRFSGVWFGPNSGSSGNGNVTHDLLFKGNMNINGFTSVFKQTKFEPATQVSACESSSQRPKPVCVRLSLSAEETVQIKRLGRLQI